MIKPNKRQLAEIKAFTSESPAQQLVVANLTAEIGTREDGTIYTAATPVHLATGVSRYEVIHVLQALAKMKLGDFKAGRRGLDSRLEWSVDPLAVVQAGEQKVKGKAKDKTTGMESFTLQTGRTVYLPPGLTKEELRDLYLWVGQQALS